ncbi:hypothetical protein BLOT_000243 [Blomia tropicalis]|nr:hypothetical protein BLOT_000243 [Blomia tropicalis]
MLLSAVTVERKIKNPDEKSCLVVFDFFLFEEYYKGHFGAIGFNQKVLDFCSSVENNTKQKLFSSVLFAIAVIKTVWQVNVSKKEKKGEKKKQNIILTLI